MCKGSIISSTTIRWYIVFQAKDKLEVERNRMAEQTLAAETKVDINVGGMARCCYYYSLCYT